MENKGHPEYAIRRIVTGFDAAGKSIITMDGPAPNQNIRPGGTISTLIWGTDETPAEIRSDRDYGDAENVIEPPPMGSWLRIVEFPPGCPGRMHRTETVDYAICMTGEIDMEMDDGFTLHMKKGDVMVQQGTNHSWINRGSETCRIAFVLIDAKESPTADRKGPGPQALTPLAPVPTGKTPPLPPIRRIVTTHDAQGKAIVMMDGSAPQRVMRGDRGNASTLIWGTDETPADMWTAEDIGLRENEIEPPPRGSWFRIIDYPPGMPGRMHRTDTIDYVICMQGDIDMELDDGAMVHMGEGDVMIQNGTNHSWINNSDKPCQVAFILLEAKPQG